MCRDVLLATRGYHVNDEERCLKFISDKDYLITSPDKYWLGKGMYFWDNRNNAKYWLGEKVRKKPEGKYITVIADITFNEEDILDLSDSESENALEELWKSYCHKKKESIFQPLGVKIDKLFDFYDELQVIKVVKGIGDYNIKNTRKHEFVNIDTRYSGPQIRTDLKVIYCVREPSKVINRKKMEDS